MGGCCEIGGLKRRQDSWLAASMVGFFKALVENPNTRKKKHRLRTSWDISWGFWYAHPFFSEGAYQKLTNEMSPRAKLT